MRNVHWSLHALEFKTGQTRSLTVIHWYIDICG